MYGDDIPRGKIDEFYPASYPTLVGLAAMLRSLVEQFCRDQKIKVQAVEARAKEVQSLEDKFRRHPDYQWLSDTEDLCGVRIIAFYLEDIIAIRGMLYDEFEILKEEDRRATQPETFGYQSLHLIARLPERRRGLSEYRAFADFKIEFQVRTVLQHAWGVISHALDYKTEGDIPVEVRRKLFRVAALLETGDELFGAFRTEVEGLRAQYKRQVTAEEWRQLPLNLDSALLSWNRLPVAAVREVAVNVGFTLVKDSTERSDGDFRSSISRLVTLATIAGCETVGDLADIVSGVSRMNDMLASLVKASKKRGFTPIGDPSDVVVLSLLLEKPELRVRGAVPFRIELEDALDQVIHQKGAR